VALGQDWGTMAAYRLASSLLQHWLHNLRNDNKSRGSIYCDIHDDVRKCLARVHSCLGFESMARPATKRATAYAIVNASSNLASIYASYFYPKSQGPRYWQANTANLAFACLCIVFATVTRFYLVWRNQQLENAAVEDVADGFTGPVDESKAALVAAQWQCDPRIQVYAITTPLFG
jgi:hypothetical protein